MCLKYIYITEYWAKTCTSCDIDSNPSEDFSGKMTLAECKQKCVEHGGCTAVDYGKGSKNQECYLNYGGRTTYKENENYDAYTLKRKHGYIYLHTQMVLLNNIYIYIY